MEKANLNVIENELADDIRLLLHKQEEILLDLKKEDHRLLNFDSERVFLKERNNRLREKLFYLTNIVKKLMPSGG